VVYPLIKPSDCSECRYCCVFTENDLWEFPTSASFVGEPYYYNQADKLFHCAALTPQGCSLGNDKPLDCKLWPFRLMQVGDKVAVTVSQHCRTVRKRTIEEILTFLDTKLSAELYNNDVNANDYHDGYIILRFLDIQNEKL
jgi:Fe-S-cluster containining protein